MKRIVIFGGSGTGKSTLARNLGEKLGLPVYHLDKFYWKPGWQAVSRPELDAAIHETMAKDEWIMDGCYSRTLPERLERCDTVIYMDFNRFACIFGILQRYFTNLGKVRPDMSEGCEERLNWDFMVYIWTYNDQKRARNYEYLAQAGHAQVVILKNRRQVNKFLESIS